MKLEELLKDVELKAQVDEMIQAAVNKQKEEWEKQAEQEKQDLKSGFESDYAEKQRKEGMSEEQKLQEALIEKERLLKENAKILLTQLAAKELSNRGLTVDFAEFLVGEDEEKTLGNILTFEKKFFAAVNEKIKERIPGYTPGKGSEAADPFLMGFAGIGGHNG